MDAWISIKLRIHVKHRITLDCLVFFMVFEHSSTDKPFM